MSKGNTLILSVYVLLLPICVQLAAWLLSLLYVDKELLFVCMCAGDLFTLFVHRVPGFAAVCLLHFWGHEKIHLSLLAVLLN